MDKLFAPGFPGLKLKVALVREGKPRRKPQVITGPQDAFRLIRRIGKEDREHFVVILLNAKNLPLGVHLVSIGSLTASLVHPREVFKPALLANAAALILAHNHPSGDPTPSPDDLALTRRLMEAGRLLGIEVLDHLIVAGRRFLSLKEQGAMDERMGSRFVGLAKEVRRDDRIHPSAPAPGAGERADLVRRGRWLCHGGLAPGRGRAHPPASAGERHRPDAVAHQNAAQGAGSMGESL